MQEALAVDTKRAGELLSLSERTVQRLIRSNRIRVVRAGRRVCVPIDSLEEFLRVDSHPSAETLRRSEEN
jgi:excisionase family DNA binding protein